eukprot:9470034-Pyramimonas_sp.AAC.1
MEAILAALLQQILEAILEAPLQQRCRGASQSPPGKIFQTVELRLASYCWKRVIPRRALRHR